MAFDSLSEKLQNVFRNLRSKGRLTEDDVKTALKEVKMALLEADVNFKVVKGFIKDVQERAVGQDVMNGLNPGQMVIKIVNEELIAMMGGTSSKIEISPKPPTIILMCGLQGSGKTTMCGKLSLYLKKQGKKVLLVAGDVYRPAAIQQLKVVGKRVGSEVFDMGQTDPVKIAENGVAYALKNGFDTVIIDTAGRLHIDEALMKELINVKSAVRPTEILLVVDSMTGQDAVTVADTFNKTLNVTGVIMTKLDGDTRGGAALSIKAVTGKPIKFSGTGEKPEDLEPFHPDRMASRILGMGDVLTLIEKAEQAFSKEQAENLQKRIKEKSFNLEDYLEQLESVKKMGGIGDMMKMLPGFAGKVKSEDLDEEKLLKAKVIIQSMTPKERRNPEIIKGSRRKRIALGSGTSIQDVNQLLKQFELMKEMMNRMQKGGMKGLKGMKGMQGLPF